MAVTNTVGVAAGGSSRRAWLHIYPAMVVVVVVAAVAWWTISVFSTGGWWLLHEQLAWRFTTRWAALVALLILVLVVCCLHWSARLSTTNGQRPSTVQMAAMSAPERAARVSAFRRLGVKGVIMGDDGRVSTSKVQVAIWTAALVFGLLLLLLVGRTPNCPIDPRTSFGSCPRNPMAGIAFADLLGARFRWEYLLLLGWPVAVAVAAKQQVISALDQIDQATGAATDPSKPSAGSADAAGSGTGADVKAPPTDPASMGVVAGLRDLVADDEGRGNLLDLQYLAFTLITVSYFVLQITTHPAKGLPEIPAALLVLMGIAGGGYLSGKILDPLGAKSSRGVPPPPMTPGTSDAAPPTERSRGRGWRARLRRG